MSENLMSPDHKATNKEYRENYSNIFRKVCEYHGGREGRVLVSGLWLCEQCMRDVLKDLEPAK